MKSSKEEAYKAMTITDRDIYEAYIDPSEGTVVGVVYPREPEPEEAYGLSDALEKAHRRWMEDPVHNLEKAVAPYKELGVSVESLKEYDRWIQPSTYQSTNEETQIKKRSSVLNILGVSILTVLTTVCVVGTFTMSGILLVPTILFFSLACYIMDYIIEGPQ